MGFLDCRCCNEYPCRLEASTSRGRDMSFKISGPGFYKTRDGRKAWVAGKSPFNGRWLGSIDNYADGYDWDVSGRYAFDDGEGERDIIGPWREPVRRRLSGWANVYETYTCAHFDCTRAEADRFAVPGRVACVYISGVEGEEP